MVRLRYVIDILERFARASRAKAKSQSGFTIIGGVVAGVVIMAGLFAYVKAAPSFRKQQLTSSRTVLAEIYASELLEFFRAYNSSAKILSPGGFFAVNPVNSASNSYYLCSHINILDRSSGNKLNPDPLADLPPSELDQTTPNGTNLDLSANRYYKFDVVDLGTGATPSLTPDTSFCAKNAKTGAITLTSSQKLLVTVGVNWIPPGETPKNAAQAKSMAKEVVLSTVLPMTN